MRDSDESLESLLPAFLGFVAVISLLNWFIGYTNGRSAGTNEATLSTTILCVESPKECKINYDYYRLRHPKNE
jgi:hypothetical protein